MSYYNIINKAYVRKKSLYINDDYTIDRIKTYELLLKIISYNDNDDTKFDIFYEKHMANFKLTQHYDIYHIRKKPFINSFENSKDFITTFGKMIWWYSYKNCYKEIHAFLTDIIKIIENDQKPTSLFYEQINKSYVNQKSLYMYNNYNNGVKIYALLLKIISYNNNDDTKFDIFYKKHMANFKLTQHYDIYHIQKEPFNSFKNSEDFITTVGKIIWWYSYKNFCKEIHAFLTDIIKIIANEEELKNKLNASIVANDIINNIFPEVIKDIPEKQPEENIKLKELKQICKVLENRGFNNTLNCMRNKAQSLEENQPIYYYNRIHELYNMFRTKSTEYNYHINVYNILLKIIDDYTTNNYLKFDIFYKKHMANFKLNKCYSATILYYSKFNSFNSFDNTKDFIDKICCIYDDNNFYKELSALLINVIHNINKPEENKSIDIKKPIVKEIEPIKTKKKPISATIKRLVWNKWIGEEIGKAKCLCCNLTAITQLSFNAGHIIAESNGGETNVSNLKPICQNCNSSMGTKNMIDFMKTLN